MFVYLARPIDQAGESSFLSDLTLTIEKRLALAGIGAFRPHSAYMAQATDPTHAELIDSLNNQAIYETDAMVAIVLHGVATLGVPVEVQSALMYNKPVLIFTDILGSVQLAAWRKLGATVLDVNHEAFDFPKQSDLRALRALLQRVPDPDAGSEPHNGPDSMPVKYDPGALKLTKAHPGDAGFDLATLEDTTVHAGEWTMLRTGVSCAVPEGWWGRITGRSSTRIRWNLAVQDAVIDAGYTGELMIGVNLQGQGNRVIPAGTRLAQYILHPVWDGIVVPVTDLPQTARGTNGYGSSGA